MSATRTITRQQWQKYSTDGRLEWRQTVVPAWQPEIIAHAFGSDSNIHWASAVAFVQAMYVTPLGLRHRSASWKICMAAVAVQHPAQNEDVVK
jgi:hypothetical protein